MSIEQSSPVPTAERIDALAEAWGDAVESFLEDGVLDEREEERLVAFKGYFDLPQEVLDKNGALTKTVKAAVLRDVLNGVIPRRVTLNTDIPINFQKGERLVWLFTDCSYLEDKTKRSYVGGSHGVSLRVMKGVYYRIGAFKGHAVNESVRTHVDTGLVVVTDKNIYFAGPKKSVRVPYGKILSFEPFTDGIGLLRDATTAKPQIFLTGDGWFTYNLVTNLARL